MKKTITYIIAGVAILFAASCTQLERPDAEQGDVFALQLFSAEMTKGEPAPGEFDENTVSSLDYYFFADESTAAVFHFRDSAPAEENGKYRQVFVPGTEYGGVAFPNRAVLYGSADHTIAFVVANLPEDKVPAELPTLPTLKSLVVDQTFLTTKVNQENHTVGVALATQNAGLRLIMSAQENVRGALTANWQPVKLQRLAAKFTFTVNVAATFTQSGELDGVPYIETWTPMLGEAYGEENPRVYLQNAVINATLGAADETPSYPSSLSQIDYDEVYPTFSATSSGFTATNVGPFYTYPVSWSDSFALAPFGKIVIPWKVERRSTADNSLLYSSQREVYYQVRLPFSEIVANNYYKLTADLTVVGTETDPEVDVVATYQVVDWVNGGAGKVNGQISDIKYLTVDRSKEIKQKDNVLRNEFYINSTQLQYNASGAVEIKWNESSIYYMDNSGDNGAVKKNIVNNGAGVTNNGKVSGNAATILNTVKTWFSFVKKGEDTFLEINHTLVNDLTKSLFDSSPYYFDLVLCLTADNTVKKAVKFIQIPAMYIDPQESNGYLWVNNYRNNQSREACDDSGQITESGYLGGIGGSSMTSNHNLYSITVSVLGEENTITYDNQTVKMVIGDPRGPAVPLKRTFNLGGSNGNQYQYRPTASDRQNYVAPKFIVASSYGSTTPTTYEGAQKRCASYQENGYPAGRWRLPTAAEIQFMITLSDKGRIPPLFSPDQYSYYWAGGEYGVGGTRPNANAKYPIEKITGKTYYWNTVPTGGGTGYVWWTGGYWTGNYYGAWTRCVYDEWYWGDDKLSNATTWGGFRTDFIN